MAADLITLAEGALLTQFLTPTAKHYGEVALKRIQRLGKQAKRLLAGVSREAQPVEEKVLFPLVQAASLEPDPSLAEHWAALLANAADPAGSQPIKPVFVEILKQLTAEEARLLFRLFEKADILKSATNTKPEGMEAGQRKGRTIEAVLDLSRERNAFLAQSGAVPNSASEQLERQIFDAMADNLLRQRVVVPADSLRPFVGSSTGPDSYRPETGKVFFTSLGYDFMLAVTAPT